MPTCKPRACKCLTSAITSGVLPAPPATTLPTTITGTLKRSEPKSPARYKAQRRRTARPWSCAKGQSRQASHPRVSQACSRSCFTLFLPFQSKRASRDPGTLLRAGLGEALGGIGDLRQAMAPGGFHHRDDRLVRGAGIGADDDDAVFAGL